MNDFAKFSDMSSRMTKETKELLTSTEELRSKRSAVRIGPGVPVPPFRTNWPSRYASNPTGPTGAQGADKSRNGSLRPMTKSWL